MIIGDLILVLQVPLRVVGADLQIAEVGQVKSIVRIKLLWGCNLLQESRVRQPQIIYKPWRDHPRVCQCDLTIVVDSRLVELDLRCSHGINRALVAEQETCADLMRRKLVIRVELSVVLLDEEGAEKDGRADRDLCTVYSDRVVRARSRRNYA